MTKSFNSETARKLARQNGLRLVDIESHRSDEKITIDDVKRSILTRRSMFGKTAQNFGIGMMGSPTPFYKHFRVL
jgi:hypothetical protein